MRCLTVLCFIGVGIAIAAAASAQAPAGPCKVVFDAMLRETATPHRVVTATEGKPVSEAISTADATFVKVRGEWRKSPWTPKNALAQQQENIRAAIAPSCTALPDAVVDGTPANVYHMHYETADAGASDATVWIGKAAGLPIQTDVRVQEGQKTSIVTHYYYDHITAPVVK
jgi:hypothetical protein